MGHAGEREKGGMYISVKCGGEREEKHFLSDL